jgi:hypothetical protein
MPKMKFDKKLKPSIILSFILSGLMIIQSLAGILIKDIYKKDSVWSRAAWNGNDIVILFVFVPLLLISLNFVLQGSRRAQLIWLGILACITYNYIYYAVAVSYNNFFLLYVALFGISFYSFVFAALNTDMDQYKKLFSKETPIKISAVIMFLFAGSLAVMWISQSILFIIKGSTTQEGLGLISAVDLVFVAAPVVLSALWLLKKEARGYVFSIITMIQNGVYSLVLVAFTPFAAKEKLSDAYTLLPLWIIFFLICLMAAGLLLMGIKIKKSRPH